MVEAAGQQAVEVKRAIEREVAEAAGDGGEGNSRSGGDRGSKRLSQRGQQEWR